MKILKKQRKVFLIIYLFCTIINDSSGQIRPLKDLIDEKNSAWPMVKEWISQAKNHVEILPKKQSAADTTLLEAQVTTRSPMGAIIFETGGLLVDTGWIRILGSGSIQLHRTLMNWNKGKSYNKKGEQPSFLLIADDVLGGLFAVNGGGIDTNGIGKVFYFAPDNLKWENMEMSYSEFLQFCFNGDLREFYSGFRWTNWQKDVISLDGDYGFIFFPPLWSQEGQTNINSSVRKKISMTEIWDTYIRTK